MDREEKKYILTGKFSHAFVKAPLKSSRQKIYSTHVFITIKPLDEIVEPVVLEAEAAAAVVAAVIVPVALVLLLLVRVIATQRMLVNRHGHNRNF